MSIEDQRRAAIQSIQDADLRQELARFVLTCSPSALQAIIGAAGWRPETQRTQEQSR